MTNRGLALLAFKLLGLWLIANAAIGAAAIPYYWQPQFEGVRGVTIFATVLPVLVSVGIGVPVWLSADWFAARSFPAEAPQPVLTDSLRPQPILALALLIIGVLLVCESLPVLVNGLALFAQSRHAGSSLLGSDVDQQRLLWSAAAKANLAGNIAKLAIGLGLIAGPGRLSTFVARLRKELGGTLSDDAQRKPME